MREIIDVRVTQFSSNVLVVSGLHDDAKNANL